MKKHLLCTSAIALGALAAPAMAQEWDLDVHGYFNQHAGYASPKLKVGNGWSDNKAYRKAKVKESVVMTNAEIHFTPSITLDNGLTFGVNVQLEADNHGNSGGKTTTIDESYMYISGERFGKLIVGSENSAGYLMMVGAPGVTSMYINSPSVSAYIPFSRNVAPYYDDGEIKGYDLFRFRNAAISSYTEVGGNNDAQRITYFTPNWNGFMMGFSYAPTGAYTNDEGRNGGAINNGIFDRRYSLNDIVDVGASYSGEFGASSVTIAGRYGTGNLGKNLNGKDPETWGVGARFGYAGFTFGGSYAKNNNPNDGYLGPDSQGWSLGATYDTGAGWSFEALTYQGKIKNKGRIIEATDAKGKYQAYRIGASRDIGPGIDWDVYGVYVKSKNGVGQVTYTDNNNVQQTDNFKTQAKGFGIGTALNLSF